LLIISEEITQYLDTPPSEIVYLQKQFCLSHFAEGSLYQLFYFYRTGKILVSVNPKKAL